MKRHLEHSDIPIHLAVIAWQPAFLRRSPRDALAGAVAVFALLDPAERTYAMTHGACWCDWAKQSASEALETLDWLKSIMVHDYGIAPHRIEAAFACIPEYRERRTDRNSIRDTGRPQKSRFSVKTH